MLRGINEGEPARAGVNHTAGAPVGYAIHKCRAGAKDWSALTCGVGHECWRGRSVCVLGVVEEISCLEDFSRVVVLLWAYSTAV